MRPFEGKCCHRLVSLGCQAALIVYGKKLQQKLGSFSYNVLYCLYIMLSFKKIITMATSTATKENFFLREQMQNTVNTNRAYKPKQDEFIV